MLRNKLQHNTVDLTTKLCFGYDKFENSCSHVISSSVRIQLGQLPASEKMGEENMIKLCKSLCYFTYTFAGPKLRNKRSQRYYKGAFPGS